MDTNKINEYLENRINKINAMINSMSNSEKKRCLQALETEKKVLLACKKMNEKQMSEKPLDIQTPVVKWGICPNCKGKPYSLGKPTRVLESFNYCPECGQALDWGESNE